MDHDRFLTYEEEFHGRDRKLSRQERKIAIKKDRSHDKKTDRDQKLKRKAEQELVIPNGTTQGRVIGIQADSVQVQTSDHLYTCQMKTALRHRALDQKNILAVGDYVLFDQDLLIFHIEPRRSVLSRSDNLLQRKEQIIAANVDQVVITASIASPPLKPSLIDRYIIAAQKGNIIPIVVINKIDLIEDPTIVDTYRNIYEQINVLCIPVSAHTGEGLHLLQKKLQGKATVFSGQSGTGKSSLLNALTGSALRTQKIIAKTSKGSHTTSSAICLPLADGGVCIDTPGIKSFGLWDLTHNVIEEYFVEIAAAAKQCQFPQCSHRIEEGCAVIQAVEEGKISPIRLSSFFSLLESMQKKHRTR